MACAMVHTLLLARLSLVRFVIDLRCCVMVNTLLSTRLSLVRFVIDFRCYGLCNGAYLIAGEVEPCEVCN